MVKDMNRVYEWVYVSRMRTKENDKKNHPMTDGTSFAPYPTRLGVFHLKIHKEGRKKARKGFKKKREPIYGMGFKLTTLAHNGCTTCATS